MIRDERFYQHSYADPGQRVIWEFTLRRTTTLYPIARRDPIFTPLFTAIGFSTVGIAGTAISAVSIASAIATTAVTIGLQLLLAPKPPKPEDGKAPKTQATPYRQWCVGTNRMAGAYMLWEATGKTLCAVQAVAGHPVTAFNRYWLHDDVVELEDLDSDGRRIDREDPYGRSVWIWNRLGSESPAALPYDMIVDQFADQPTATKPWTVAHKGIGQASIALMAKSAPAENQQARFPYGVPSLSVEVEGAACWDYRVSSQDPDDPDTWTYTTNTALQLVWHLCFSEFGEKLDYRKAILPVLALWKEEADICDELVPLKGGGFEKRYESALWDTTENSPKAATNAFLGACDGHLVTRGDGARILTVGKFRESRCVTLTDADIIGHRVSGDVLFSEECNRLIPKFNYPELGYATSDTDYFESVPAQLEAGRILANEAEYAAVQKWRQARRLGIREWRRILQKIRGSLTMRLSGINAAYSRWVRLETPKRMPRLNGAIIENRKSSLSLMNASYSMDFIRHPSNIDAWDPNINEGKQPPVPPKPNLNDIVTPVINLVQSRSNGNSVYIRVDVLDPDDDSLTPVLRYRLVNDGTGNPGEWVEQEFPDVVPALGFLKLNTNVVPSDKLLDVQVMYRASKKRGDWSLNAQVTSTVDPDQPGAPEALQSSVSGGVVTFSARAAENDAATGNTAVLIFRRGTTSQAFSSAFGLKRLKAGPNDVRTITSTPGSGTWRYWCAGENVSKVVGPPSYIDVVVP